MRVFCFLALLCVCACRADDADVPDNINSKYTVESVVVLPESAAKRLSASVQAQLQTLVDKKFDPATADQLKEQIAKDLRRKVERRMERGEKPDHVKLVYSAPRVLEADADVTKLTYHSKSGMTAGFEAPFEIGPVTLRAGIQTDSDHLLERFAGYTVGVAANAGERVRMSLDYGGFHTQWNAATLRALESRPDIPGIYRERFIVSPAVSILLARPLVLSLGIDIQNVQVQFPAARFEASNAVTTTLRYRRRWSSDASRQEVDAGYGLRAATRSLGSDYAYTRHAVSAEYRAEIGKHNNISVEFLAGRLTGTAPLFDRFVLGDSRTLRGWSKFDVAPLGGTRVAHGSVEYWYRWLGCFLDSGAIWDQKSDSGVKQSAGIALGGHEGIYLAIAFPLRGASPQPLFILGMNF